MLCWLFVGIPFMFDFTLHLPPQIRWADSDMTIQYSLLSKVRFPPWSLLGRILEFSLVTVWPRRYSRTRVVSWLVFIWSFGHLSDIPWVYVPYFLSCYIPHTILFPCSFGCSSVISQWRGGGVVYASFGVSPKASTWWHKDELQAPLCLDTWKSIYDNV